MFSFMLCLLLSVVLFLFSCLFFHVVYFVVIFWIGMRIFLF